MRLVTVFGSSRVQPGTSAFAVARAWGRAIAEAGFGVATGGYNGAMEGVSQGAKEAGGLVVGITAPVLFPHRNGPNLHVDLELPSSSLLTRIERLIDVGVACLALPGGVGTLAEILAAWNLNHIALMHGKPQKPLGVHVGWLTWQRIGGLA
ncbi:LOG family protein [Meiothermus sp.]|uniref:LOG family protein n=1 Tax=Meiothermus sp. TaxID=1955249 RepID=UPI0021DDF3F1|nr:LOG family protein [Meiothermus sp.]GIW26206.1 MAG: DNA-binding protein [Meiothermus sp.]